MSKKTNGNSGKRVLSGSMIRSAIASATGAAVLGANTANAALQTVAAPTQGAGDDGNYMQMMQNYAYDGAMLLGGLATVFGLFAVAKNGMGVYHEIGEGKKKWADLTGHLVAGFVLIMLVIAIVAQLTGVMEGLV